MLLSRKSRCKRAVLLPVFGCFLNSLLPSLGHRSGKRVSAPESEPAAPAKPAVNMDELRAEIRAELKAKMEEEYYNKG